MVEYYEAFLSPAAALGLAARAKVVHNGGPDEPIVKVAGGVIGNESGEALAFAGRVFAQVRSELDRVLSQRSKDRAFIDQRVRAVSTLNAKSGRNASDPFFARVFGQKDADGRTVFGPREDGAGFAQPRGAPVAGLPDFLKGYHVTLFGLSSSDAACEKAADCFNARRPGEPSIVDELLSGAAVPPPRWGVDAEDSQTPRRLILAHANDHLGKYLKSDASSAKKAAQAFKRLPGLGLPSTFCFFDDKPAPLHLYDFCLHLFEHWSRPKALVFYVPKLESEEEAAYLATLIRTAEGEIQRSFPAYKLGSVRVLVVLENARALFRANEIADALHPYFCGASLGWHDLLASTARLFKEDGSFRIPTKADPSIVIKHVKASHELVARVVGGRGGIAIGGMYGVLPASENDAPAAMVAMEGLFKDVATQLKRGLRGVWVPREDYVRPAMAMFEAWGRLPDASALEALIAGYLVGDAAAQRRVLDFCVAPDITGCDAHDAGFCGALVVGEVPPSTEVSTSDPEQVRYNTFQSLQYLADWLAGNGCVALPGRVRGQNVCIMDDLATVERSRWEVWHEVRHGRIAAEEVVKIAHEELNFIRRGYRSNIKQTEVKYDERTAKWYPVALDIWLRLVVESASVDKELRCPEFVTELLLPLTAEPVWQAEDPLLALLQLEQRPQSDPAALRPQIHRFNYFFERCGCMAFAKAMARTIGTDLAAVERAIMAFSLDECVEAASFHGNIGESAATLDKMASAEQAQAHEQGMSGQVERELRELGAEYLKKFGVKFLVSAKGKSGSEMLAILKSRIGNTSAQELENARAALWEITRKRLESDTTPGTTGALLAELEALRAKHIVSGASICVTTSANGLQDITLGESQPGIPVAKECLFEIASLSKTVGSAFAIEYFAKRGVGLDAPVNELLRQAGSSFRLDQPTDLGDKVLLRHLMSHCALNMHYVNGVPADEPMPPTLAFLRGNDQYGYPPIEVINEPGTVFKYSGGGFLVLAHLIESFEKKPIAEITRPFLESLGVAEEELTFEPKPANVQVAYGFDDQGAVVNGTRLMFPSFAAGALGTPNAMLRVLDKLSQAYAFEQGEQESDNPISHDTACEMLHGTDKGCMDFMGCRMGVGVFVAEAGPNRFTVHQGANDGFRSVFLHCFDGPDKGTGLACFANGDNRAMFFIAEAMQRLLAVLRVQGVDVSQFANTAMPNIADIPQEEIVNYGYKALVFSAFSPTLPEGIVDRGPPDPLAPINKMVGAKLVKVSSQRFARVQNLASDHLPKFDPELFCPMGKVMDSWETARHNPNEYDEAVFRLDESRRSGKVAFVAISTKYHYGNQAQFVRIFARAVATGEWVEIVPKTSLEGHSDKRVRLPDHLQCDFQEVKIQIFPDGGLSRIGLFSEHVLPKALAAGFLPISAAPNVPSPDPIPQTKKPLQLLFEPSPAEVAANRSKLQRGQFFDAASLALGSELVSVTNQHYGPAAQVFSPFIPLSMHDGFESARSRTPGHREELVVKLGVPALVEAVELDFAFFVNNNPRSVAVLAKADAADASWKEIVPETQVKAFAGNTKVLQVPKERRILASQLQLLVFPDGGVNRFRAMAHFEAPRPANL